jgi:hypothetical protein
MQVLGSAMNHRHDAMADQSSARLAYLASWVIGGLTVIWFIIGIWALAH